MKTESRIVYTTDEGVELMEVREDGTVQVPRLTYPRVDALALLGALLHALRNQDQAPPGAPAPGALKAEERRVPV